MTANMSGRNGGDYDDHESHSSVSPRSDSNSEVSIEISDEKSNRNAGGGDTTFHDEYDVMGADSGRQAKTDKEEEPESSLWKRAKPKLLKHHLPLWLVFVIFLGLVWPTPGRELGEEKPGPYLVGIIFFISGLTLKTEDIKKAITAWPASIFAIVSILFITPMAAWLMLEVELDVAEFGTGLALFFVMPTTLSSGVVLTKEAKGNYALALMITVTTNLLGILTIPFLMQWIFAGSDAEIEPAPLLEKLVYTILLPLLFGKALRNLKQVEEFVKNNGTTLKLLSSFALVLVPWTKVSLSADDIYDADGVSLLYTILLAIAVHFLYLVVNYGITTILRMPLAEKKAVVILTSEKTLPVALTVLEFLDDDFGAKGLIAIPCVVAHFSQIIIDAFVASKWASYVDEEEDKDNSKASHYSVNDQKQSPERDGESVSALDSSV